MKCICYAAEIEANDESVGFSVQFKFATVSAGALVAKGTGAVTIPFGTSAATMLSTLKAAVVQAAKAYSGASAMQTTDVIVYGASLN